MIDPKERKRLYAVWAAMRQRCRNPKHKRYADYGGRNIRIDPAWNSFEQFLTDMGPRPSRQHSLDREDNDGNYTPSNCRWATALEQSNNQRVLKLTDDDVRAMRVLHRDGAKQCDLAERFGVSPTMVSLVVNRKTKTHVLEARP